MWGNWEGRERKRLEGERERERERVTETEGRRERTRERERERGNISAASGRDMWTAGSKRTMASRAVALDDCARRTLCKSERLALRSLQAGVRHNLG